MHHRDRRAGSFWSKGIAVGAVAASWPALGTDIVGVMPAALDQPRVNAMIRYPVAGGAMGDPLYADFGGGTRAFNIEAFFDTGASGVLLSRNTANFLTLDGRPDLYNPGVQLATYNGKPVIFEDVGVGGAEQFNVSVPIHVSVAPTSSVAAERIGEAEARLGASSPPGFGGIDLGVYGHTSGPIRAQVGPFVGDDPSQPNDNPLLSDLDVIGMPLMRGKVVVMDPKPVENIISGSADFGFTMNTYVYDPGTPYRATTAKTDPGIPRTTRTIKMSYGSFGEFTRTGTLDANGDLVPLPAADAAAYGSTLERNPFIGPNPIAPSGDPTPGVKVKFNGRSTTGSFLLDTGAAASMISTHVAAGLNVRVTPGTEDTDDPRLETFDPLNPSAPGTPVADQFALSIGGVGGTKKVPGFFLSSMLLRTLEGDAANDDDARHLRFVDAPVLVTDITVKNPTSGREVTLDGIFGMNNLVASIFLSEPPGGVGFPDLANITPGAFDWVVFDEPGGLLKLRPRVGGDANRDGAVDFLDLALLAANYNTEVTSDLWGSGDFNGDGMVDFLDLAVMAAHYNSDELLPTDVIHLPHYQLGDLGFLTEARNPEPGGVGLIAAGAVAALGRRRRAVGGR